MLIHGHQGLPGNKEAHRLAREGAVEFQFTDEIYERAIRKGTGKDKFITLCLYYTEF